MTDNSRRQEQTMGKGEFIAFVFRRSDPQKKERPGRIAPRKNSATAQVVTPQKRSPTPMLSKSQIKGSLTPRLWRPSCHQRFLYRTVQHK